MATTAETLDNIADAAGFTTGAASRASGARTSCSFALYDDWVDQRIADLARYRDPPNSFEALLRADARRFMALRNEHSDWYLLLLEFWTYAAREDRPEIEVQSVHSIDPPPSGKLKRFVPISQ